MFQIARTHRKYPPIKLLSHSKCYILDLETTLTHLVHVLREVVNSIHTGSIAAYADGPGQAMNHQPRELLARSVHDVLMIYFC